MLIYLMSLILVYWQCTSYVLFLLQISYLYIANQRFLQNLNFSNDRKEKCFLIYSSTVSVSLLNEYLGDRLSISMFLINGLFDSSTTNDIETH